MVACGTLGDKFFPVAEVLTCLSVPLTLYIYCDIMPSTRSSVTHLLLFCRVQEPSS